jgi:hypothetical protein
MGSGRLLCATVGAVDEKTIMEYIENQRGDLEPLIIFIPTGTVATTYCVIAESDVSTKLTGKGSTEKARLGTAEAP